MKILLVSNDPNIFNASSAVHARMRAYAYALGELHVLSAALPSAVETHEGALHLYPVFSSRLFRMRVLTKKARVLITLHDIEVVSAQDPFEHGRAAMKAALGTKAKLHIQIHTDFLSPYFADSFKNKLRIKMADKVLPCAAGIRVVSKRIQDSLVKKYGDRIPVPSIIPVAADTSEVPSAKLPGNGFKFTFIAVGRLEEEKHFDDMLAAFKEVHTRYPLAGLYIAGDGRARRALEKMAAALGLGQNVVFLGARADARALMPCAHAFVQASAYEGYGVTLIEAALAKIPIITTDVGIVGDVLMSNRDALVSTPVNPHGLAEHMIRIIEDNPLRRTLTLSAAASAEAHLSACRNQPAMVAEDLAKLARSSDTHSTTP